MTVKSIDINCDLGEGYGSDALLMPYLSSCNIACGGHFGNTDTMIAAIRLAKKYQVKIGAHPAFPDQLNFGRQVMAIDSIALQNTVADQIININSICIQENQTLNHVKLHGALYNLAVNDKAIATSILKAFLKTKLRFKVYTPDNSMLSKIIKNDFETVPEAFIDRAYNTDLSLVSRAQRNALIQDKYQAWAQLILMVNDAKVKTISQESIAIRANTYCIHGDAEGAVEILAYIHSKLKEEKIAVK